MTPNLIVGLALVLVGGLILLTLYRNSENVGVEEWLRRRRRKD